TRPSITLAPALPALSDPTELARVAANPPGTPVEFWATYTFADVYPTIEVTGGALDSVSARMATDASGASIGAATAEWVFDADTAVLTDLVAGLADDLTAAFPDGVAVERTTSDDDNADR